MVIVMHMIEWTALLHIFIRVVFVNSSRDGNTRPLDLPLEKSVCRSGGNSYSWIWNNRLISNRERNMLRLYIVTLLM